MSQRKPTAGTTYDLIAAGTSIGFAGLGVRGATGIQGEQGDQGTDGTDGVDGEDGRGVQIHRGGDLTNTTNLPAYFDLAQARPITVNDPYYFLIQSDFEKWRY